MKLSIAMIVKNEEKNIERTLIPLKELGKYIESEIVIVDTGSDDKTIEIARKYTDKIYFEKWNNNFASMRNISINYCTGDWILVIDADEELVDVEEAIRLFKSELINDYNGGYIKIVNFDSDIEKTLKYGSIAPMLRLFKRNTVKYVRAIHEQPEYKEPLIDTNLRFIHYGYDNNDSKLMEYKFKRNIELLFKELKDNPKDIYTNFQIATSYLMYGNIVKAREYIEIAYNEAKKNINKYIYVVDKYCLILFKDNDYEGLLKKAREGIKHYSKSIDFNFYLGFANLNLMQYKEAIIAFESYLKYSDDINSNFNTTLSVQTLKYKSEVIHNLAVCYYKMKSYVKALKLLLRNGKTKCSGQEVLLILKNIIEGKLFDKVKEIDKLIDKDNYHILLDVISDKVSLEDLNEISKHIKEGVVKEAVDIVRYFRENECLNDKYYHSILRVFDENDELYSVLVYYVLKRDVNTINSLIKFGKDKLETMLIGICNTYYDINDILLNWIENYDVDNIRLLAKKVIIEKAILLGGNLRKDKRQEIFLSYICDRFILISNLYKDKIISEDTWILSDEDRFIINVKKSLEYKYENTLDYIRLLKNTLTINKSYTEYIKLLTENIENECINNEIKLLIPTLVTNVQLLISEENYQEAYDTINEGLNLVGFNLDLMMLKYNLLKAFGYRKEEIQVIKEIILYGESDKIKPIINIYNKD